MKRNVAGTYCPFLDFVNLKTQKEQDKHHFFRYCPVNNCKIRKMATNLHNNMLLTKN